MTGLLAVIPPPPRLRFSFPRAARERDVILAAGK